MFPEQAVTPDGQQDERAERGNGKTSQLVPFQQKLQPFKKLDEMKQKLDMKEGNLDETRNQVGMSQWKTSIQNKKVGEKEKSGAFNLLFWKPFLTNKRPFKTAQPVTLPAWIRLIKGR